MGRGKSGLPYLGCCLSICVFLSVFDMCNSYPCEWGGVVNGNPYLKNLDEFGKTVLEDLWKAVVEQFVEVSNSLIQIP